MIDGLFHSGLDRLWVSFDGADEARISNRIRQGARIPRRRRQPGAASGAQRAGRPARSTSGSAFVVLKSNVADLTAMDELARSVGADRILVSNVLPYSPDMEKEMLCQLTLTHRHLRLRLRARSR